jgi:hypothetical protein
MRNGKLRLIVLAIAVGLTLSVITTADADHSVLERVSVGPNGTGNSSSAGAAAAFAGSSTDGLREFFDTKEALDPGDTDTSTDLYERSPAQTTLISTSSTAGNGAFDALYAGASDDGTRVFFHTREALVPGDTDSNRFDLYERFNGVTTLISTGPTTTNALVDAFFRGASADGTKVFFETPEALTASDTKARSDVYQRQGTTTTLVSTGPTSAAGSFFARFRGASVDGSLVFFESDDRLTAGDTDLETDVYERNVGTSTTTLLSIGPNGGNAAVPAFFDSSSDTGSRVFFHTAERLDTTADTDGFTDVYERAASTTTIVTTSATGGNGPRHADFAGSSADGTTVYFETDESMLAADNDLNFDVYKRTGGVTTLASDGPAGTDPNVDATALGVSDDGSRVWFDTTEQILATDSDAQFDLYERQGTTTTHVSNGSPGGNGAHDAFFATAAGDGTRVIFDTAESLVTADTDSSFDTYERLPCHVRRGDAERHVRVRALVRAAGRRRHRHRPGRVPGHARVRRLPPDQGRHAVPRLPGAGVHEVQLAEHHSWPAAAPERGLVHASDAADQRRHRRHAGCEWRRRQLDRLRFVPGDGHAQRADHGSGHGCALWTGHHGPGQMRDAQRQRGSRLHRRAAAPGIRPDDRPVELDRRRWR